MLKEQKELVNCLEALDKTIELKVHISRSFENAILTKELETTKKLLDDCDNTINKLTLDVVNHMKNIHVEPHLLDFISFVTLKYELSDLAYGCSDDDIRKSIMKVVCEVLDKQESIKDNILNHIV